MKRILYLFIILFIIGACGKKEEVANQEIKKEEKIKEEIKLLTKYDLITHTTNGLIFHKNSIAVVFNPNYVNKDTEKELKAVIKFEPEIEGDITFAGNTLTFKPKDKWAMRTKYKVILDVGRLFPNIKKDFETFDFVFETTGVEIFDIKLDTVSVEANNPKKVKIKGEIVFNDDVIFDKIKESIKAFKFDEKGQKIFIPLILNQNSNLKRITIDSAELERNPNKEEIVYVEIDKEKTEISETKIKEIKIPMLKELDVLEMKIEDRNEKAVSIRFTDILDKDMNLDGFFHIEPALDFKISKSPQKIMLIGNFKYDQEYTITGRKGIKSKWGSELKKDVSIKVKLGDLAPQVEYSSEGVFLPSSNNSKLRFRALNVGTAKITVSKIYENNIFFFLQEAELQGNKKSRQEKGYYFYRIGKQIHTQNIEITKEKNKWTQNEIDLSKIFTNDKTGLYFIEISFEEKDILGNHFVDKDRWTKRNYFYDSAKAVKPIIISDIGLYAKKSGEELYVQAINVINGKPMSNVKVIAKDYRNQNLQEAITDTNGRAVIQSKDIFFIEGSIKEQKSVLKLNNSLDMAGFDVEGEGSISNNGFTAFMYTERGVYRPGDELNVSLILRNGENSVPDNFPVKYKLHDPKGKIINEGINKDGINGFYTFNFKTKSNDLTGDWNFVIDTGNTSFSKNLKIETVVPHKIRVNIESEKDSYSLREDKSVKFNVNSQYLFGNPAANLPVDNKITIKQFDMSFKNYRDFIFTNPIESVKDVTGEINIEGLDENGKAELEWSIPKIDKVLSGLTIEIESKVYEKSGRNVSKKLNIPLSYYNRFVGIKKPQNTYMKIGSNIDLKTVMLTQEGLPIVGSKLKYTIYKNNYYWWWDYNSYDDFKKHFKSNWNTEILTEGEVITNDEGALISYVPDTYGELYIEVEDPVEGHKTGMFFRAYYWGDESNEKAGQKLTVKTDKKEYKIGEKAIIVCDTPIGATAYISIEKDNKVLKHFRQDIIKAKTEIEIDVTESLFPNAYVSVYIVQSHENSKTDTPLRQYGYAPILVKDTKRIIDFDIKTNDVIEPEKDFEIEIQTKDNKKAQYTIAIVDEGLLNITNFKTPNPYKYFYMTQKLNVLNYDMYSEIIGINVDEISKSFIIGGGEDYREKQLSRGREDVERFKPVSIFKKPQWTDEKGYAKLNFKLPNYIGSVKVMVIMANDNMYGSKEKDIIVKTPLMVLPSIPRKLSPFDKVVIPVTVFATEDNIGNTLVSLKTEGPIKVIGENTKNVVMDKKGEEDIYFEIEVMDSIGKGKINIEATSDKYKSYENTDIAINSSNNYIYKNKHYFKKQNEEISLKIAENSLSGTNKTKITISKYKKFSLNQRLKWLIRYPYGCVEQTTSAVFPQLYIEKLAEISANEKAKIDININEAINKLRRFQLNNGAFSYWPGLDYENVWGTNYAGHFLTEAKKAGYYVPDSMYEPWLTYQKNAAVKNTQKTYENFYRLYILAIAGEPVLSSMNYMKQSYKNDMENTEKWLLAASYAIIGEKDAAIEIAKLAPLTAKEYKELGGNYGSTFRDKAMMLEANYYVDTIDNSVNRNELLNYIGNNLETDNWYSTQETAYALLALSRYAPNNKNKEEISGTITEPNGNKINFTTANEVYSYETTADNGEVKIESISELYVKTEWEGIPKNNMEEERTSPSISIKVKWFDDNGKEINPENLEKGKSFWAVYTISKDNYSKIEEVALVQTLPSGWEIENTRLSGEGYPNWMRYGNSNMGSEKYLDIRDDKIMWFFDMNPYYSDYNFAVKLNAVSVGEYYMPGATVEAMYNHDISASKKGFNVKVIKDNR